MICISVCATTKRTNGKKLKALTGDYARKGGHDFAVSEYPNGESLLGAMNAGRRFDVIFLDIYMGGADGIAVAREIRKTDKKCRIIFATSSRERAIEGYEVRALQYLVKPINAESVGSALDLALETLSSGLSKTIQVQNRQGIFKIDPDDIVFAESNARVVTVILKGQEPLQFYGKLDDFERECGDERFLRCHKSYLVNLDYVHAIVNNFILLEPGGEIRFSMNVTQVKERFAAHTASKI